MLPKNILPSVIVLIITSGLAGAAHGAPAEPFPEFETQGGLGIIGVLVPWGEGATGGGVPVALLDTGVRLDHVDIGPNVLPGFDFVNGDSTANDDSLIGHGTQVAGIIAALRNGFGTVGVAYDAQIIPVKVQDQEQTRRNEDMIAGIDFAIASGARIMNLSIQGETTPEIETALINAAAAGTVVVFAAGNQGFVRPTRFSRVAARMGGHGIIVGSVDANLNRASFSNEAGAFADHFMVAPGVTIETTTNSSPSALIRITGTSASTPFVSGAAAVLLSAFPNLSGAQVVQILFESATDLGEPGVDPVYGHGLLNLAAAMQPAGDLSVPGGGGSSSSFAAGALVLGGALAYAIQQKGKKLEKTLILDRYDRGYTANLPDLITVRDELPGLDSLLDSMDAETEWLYLPLAANHAVTMRYASSRPRAGKANLDFDPFVPEHEQLPNWEMSLSGDLGERWGYAFDLNTRPGRGFGLGGDGESLGEYTFLSDAAFMAPYLGFGESANSANIRYGYSRHLDFKLGFVASDDDTDDYGLKSDAVVLEGNFHPHDRASFALQFGQLDEHGSMFGGAAAGPFSVDTSDTMSVGISGRVLLGKDFALFGSYHRGATRVADRAGSVIQDVDTLYSESYGVGLSARSLFRRGDRFGFAVSRPMRVAAGSARLDVPTSIDSDGRIVSESERIDLSPAGLETDVEAYYKIRARKGAEYGLHLLFRDNPHHNAELSNDVRMYMTYVSRF